MARPSAQAVGLYYPTPPHLLASIASLISVDPGEAYSIVDPCAADGDAVIGITHSLFQGQRRHNVDLYACELERTRYSSLKAKQHSVGCRVQVEHGDALRLVWETVEQYGEPRKGASLIFLNPPYDHDRDCKRLEERFARRFIMCLAERGVFIFLVPFYALAASADTIARYLTDLHCFRFPDPDYEVFKQVVLVGTKRQVLQDPDPEVRAMVLHWSESVDGMPILGSSTAPIASLPAHPNYRSGFAKWSVAPLDLLGLQSRLQPWHTTDRAGRPTPIVGVVPANVGPRQYPLAVPPKPAHLAAAIASGVFNGAKVEADGLRPLRVKGVFVKEFVKVEDKQNEKGEKTGEVQVQQPKLVVTALDCAASTYHTLKATAQPSGSMDPDKMSTGDLLTGYGRALMDVMLDQCPVLHDPGADGDRFILPTFARKPFAAQEEAIRAIVKLLGGVAATRAERSGRTAFLLGEIGSGKSNVFLAVAATIDARRVLITCPPHLTQSWIDQARLTVPWARARVLEDVGDVDDFCTDADPTISIGIMSRSAKLAHRWAGVGAEVEHQILLPADEERVGLAKWLASSGRPMRACPRCGSPPPVDEDGIATTPDELAAKRRRCGMRRTTDGRWVADGTQRRQPADAMALAARELALALMLVSPRSPEVNQLLRGRVRDRMMIKAAGRVEHGTALARPNQDAAWARAKPRLPSIVWRVAMELLVREGGEAIGRTLLCLLGAVNDDSLTVEVVERIYASTMFDLDTYGVGSKVREWCRDAILLLREPKPVGERLKALNLHAAPTVYNQVSDVWMAWHARAEAVQQLKSDTECYRTGLGPGRTVHKHALGSVALAVEALSRLTELGTWATDPPCGEHLYQAVPDPRRVSLTHYLARRYPRVVDLFGCDEGHEVGTNSDSAQSASEHRIISLGMPVVMLTGSIMNGYAKSLFINVWSLGQGRDGSRPFRDEFKRSDEARFCRTYGYVKQLVQQKDGQGKIVEWGAQSDRRETTAKEIGYAPGVLPIFVLKHLLTNAVTIHKKDLAIDAFPPLREIVEFVEPDSEVLWPYERMLKALKQQIKDDRFNPKLAGKLFGALSEFPSYLDRATADCGNRPDGAYEIRYPINEELEESSGRVIDEQAGMEPGSVLPKEQWMLETVRRELSEGRRVMVFGWHEAALPRLQRLIEAAIKEPVALLLSKVQAKKRQDWIDREVVAKRRRVVVLNPACVKTGLNNLIWFCSQIWMENPGCDPIIYRQAVGRVDRIGQVGGPQRETRIYMPVYAGTAQVLQHKLLLHKVGVSMSTDGLDAESALQAAGVGESDALDAFSVGRALYEMMERGEAERVEAREREPRSAPQAPANDVVVVEPVVEPQSGAPKKRPARGTGQMDLFAMFEKAG